MDPATIQDAKARGDELFRSQDYSSAILAFEELARGQPGSAYGHRMIANCYIALQRFDEAVEAAQKGAALQPGDAEARYALGYALGASGRPEEGIAELDAALYLTPNHVAAKQALLYCLTQTGDKLASVDLKDAEPFFGRAHKLDPTNPQLFAKLLDLYMRSDQKGKAMRLYQESSDAVKRNTAAEEVVKRFEANPDYRVAAKQTAASAPPPSAAPKPQAPQQVPCPGCRQPIMSFAAICPHCGTKIRDYGSFAGVDRGPKVEWQEVAFTIVAILWTLWTGAGVVTGLMQQNETAKMFYTTINGLCCMVGVGMIFRWETIMFVGKIMVYLNLLGSAVGTVLAFANGSVVAGLLNVASLAVGGFMVYLFNYVDG